MITPRVINSHEYLEIDVFLAYVIPIALFKNIHVVNYIIAHLIGT